jgi:hypothetical protein
MSFGIEKSQNFFTNRVANELVEFLAVLGKACDLY